MSLEKDIETFLTKAKHDAAKVARDHHAAHQLVMYAESHVGMSKKAEFLAKVMRAASVRYHASEHFLNTPSYARAVGGYLAGKLDRSGLDSRVRALTPILDVIRAAPTTRGLVFSGSSEHDGVKRHRTIYNNFVSSRALHLKAKRFRIADRGMFHIGAFHAARLPQQGSKKSTTQLLIGSGLDVGVIRLMVDTPSSSSSTDESGALVITVDEVADVRPTGGGTSFDLMPVLRKVSGGTAFGADITSSASPFRKVKPAEVTSSRSFAEYYDRVVYLP